MIITRTPYRISLFGGGTDYPEWFRKHGGAVINATIDKYCYISATTYNKIFPQRYKVYWNIVELVEKIDDIKHPVVREGLKMLEYTDSLKLYYHGDLPAYSGLGSSSSFAVGFIHAILSLCNKTVEKQQIADLAIRLEREVLKENGGVQDQLAATYGGLNYFDFSHNGIQRQELRTAKLEEKLMLFYIGRDEDRFSSTYAKSWIDNMESKEATLKGIHQITKDALLIFQSHNPDLDELGCLLHDTWQLKKNISDMISDPLIDQIYVRARKAGALGGKVLGAGGRGFMLFYVPEKKQEAVKAALEDCHHTPFRFENDGTKYFRIS